MVTYSEDDVVDFSEFGYAWRFSGNPWGEITDEEKDAIKILSKERSNLVYVAGTPLRSSGNVNIKQYHVVSEQYFTCELKDEAEERAWLDSLPIKESEDIYINYWGPDISVITTWKIFKEHYDDFWYEDQINLFDDTLDWALLLGHNGWMDYVEKNPPRYVVDESKFNHGKGMCI
jgi:hypothetical protein